MQAACDARVCGKGACTLVYCSPQLLLGRGLLAVYRCFSTTLKGHQSECEVEGYPLDLQGDIGVWRVLGLLVFGHILRILSA